MWKGYIADVFSDRYLQRSGNSSGNAVGSIGPCPEGFCWYVERTTCYSNTSQGTPLLELYVLRSGDVAPADLSKAGRQDVYSATAAGPDNPKQGAHDYAAPIYVGPGYFLVAVWSGIATDLAVLSSQIRVHRIVHPGEHHHRGQPLEEQESGKLPHATVIVVGDEVAAV